MRTKTWPLAAALALAALAAPALAADPVGFQIGGGNTNTQPVDPNHPLPTTAPPAAPFSGQIAMTASAAAISGGVWTPSAPTIMTNGLVCKALGANSGVIYIGPSGVTSSNGYPLAAGEAISFGPTSSVNLFAFDAVNTDVLACTGS